MAMKSQEPSKSPFVASLPPPGDGDEGGESERGADLAEGRLDADAGPRAGRSS
jgi:hypothetical protein